MVLHREEGGEYRCVQSVSGLWDRNFVVDTVPVEFK